MTFVEVVRLINGKTKRTERKLGNNTYGYIMYDGSVVVELHGTKVVTFYANGLVKLNSGGYQTHTTKKRINQYSPVSVYQKDFKWFLRDGTPFEDNMLVS